MTTTARAAGALALVAILAVLPSCSVARRGAPPAAGYAELRLLPLGAHLPSGASCASRVRHRYATGWEPRSPANDVANRTVPHPTPDLGTLPDFDETANTGPRWARRVDGDFRGTTEQIVLWAACKWGLDDQWLRAQLVVESWWEQGTAGDLTPIRQNCPPDAVRDGRRCAESYGLLQNKYRFNKTAYPAFRTSSAYGLDFSAFKLRACYEGHKYVSEGVAGDWEGCVGNWFSGEWHDPQAQEYLGWVLQAKAEHVWTGWPDTDG